MRIAWAGLLFAACSGGGAGGQLAGGLGAPTQLVADADGIDFVDFRDGAAYIGRVPKSGGAVDVLVSQQQGPIATGGGELFFADTGGAVSAIPVGGGAVRSIGTVETSPDALASDGTSVFVGVAPVCIGGLPCPPRDQLVARFPIAGGAATPMYEVDAGQGHRVLGLVVDQAAVWWIEDDALLFMPSQGSGTPVSAAQVSGVQLQHVAEGGGYVYYASHHSLDGVPSTGGATFHIADEPADEIAAIAADDRGVYWLAGDRLAFRPFTGGAPQILASGLVRAQGLTADASGVYYASGTPGAADVDAGAPSPSGSIWRIAR